MKKVKIMLSAIVVLAIVGGALAFKATKFDTGYCINAVAIPNHAGQTTIGCPVGVISKLDANAQLVFAKQTSNTLQCAAVQTCTAIKIDFED